MLKVWLQPLRAQVFDMFIPAVPVWLAAGLCVFMSGVSCSVESVWMCVWWGSEKTGVQWAEHFFCQISELGTADWTVVHMADWAEDDNYETWLWNSSTMLSLLRYFAQILLKTTCLGRSSESVNNTEGHALLIVKNKPLLEPQRWAQGERKTSWEEFWSTLAVLKCKSWLIALHGFSATSKEEELWQPMKNKLASWDAGL